MEKMRALIANDPRVYREVISDALKGIRLLIDVVSAEPEELDREVARFRPHLVICSRATEVVRSASPAWVVLYPDGEDRVEIHGVGVGGHAAVRLLEGASVTDLLSVVDETELSCRSA